MSHYYMMPQYLWLATGGKYGLTSERVSSLKGRKIIVFPDIDAFKDWQQKIFTFPHLDIRISRLLEDNATPADRAAHIDLADWIIQFRKIIITELPQNHYICSNKMTTSMKYATTLDEQVEKLKDRGLVINDEEKAKEVLLDIGYYRLGAYLFPFEKKYPNKKNRDHIYKDGTNFLDALDMYYFDCDLRRLLMKYLTRIEVNIRTYITYHVSNLYKTKPCWFISHAVMKPSYVNSFYTTVYGTKAFQDNPTIIEHHKKYPMDRYAPAWKTVELMTIGNIQALYNNLKKPDVQADIALHYGVAKIGIFQSYFETIRKARNMCAHGNVLFDTKLPQRLPHGPAGNLVQPNNSNIIGIIAVIQYFIKQISIHRYQEMCDELEELLKKVKNKKVREILEKVSGFETF